MKPPPDVLRLAGDCESMHEALRRIWALIDAKDKRDG